MLVVADASPLSALAEIGHLGVLPLLFRQVLVPAQVLAELSYTPARPKVPERSRRIRRLGSRCDNSATSSRFHLSIPERRLPSVLPGSAALICF